MNIVVFLGPSLSLVDAKTILPNANFLPPARQGDILRVLRLKPDVIALIDGFFEHSGSVLHKEIVFALEKGIAVYGASSLGALRAAELASFGMHGVGEVYAQYAEGLTDDAAVTLLHGADFSANTHALVNVKATIQHALEKKIVSASSAHCLNQAAEKLFYQERTYLNIIAKARSFNIDENELIAFMDWVNQHGWYDCKKEDAFFLLKTLAEQNITKPNAIHVERSAFFRAHYKYVMCRPFMLDAPWLPLDEKIALKAYQSPLGKHLQRLAYLLAACHALARDISISETHHSEETKRLMRIEMLLQQTSPLTKQTRDDYCYYLMKLSKTQEYKHYRSLDHFREKMPNHYAVFWWIARLWWLIEQYAAERHLIPSDQALIEFSQRFRMKNQLFSAEAMEQWLHENNLTVDEYAHMMQAASRLHYFVLQNNLDALGIIDDQEGIWWFNDAMHVSGIYDEVNSGIVDQSG